MLLLSNFQTSVKKALSEIDPDFMKLKGLVVCGSHTPSDIEFILGHIKAARETKLPMLGICMGMQLMAIEYARNVLGLDANSTEIQPDTPNPVVIELPSLRVGMKEVKGRQESHWHKFIFNRIYQNQFQYWGFVIDQDIVEQMTYFNHPFFVGTQYHWEYQSNQNNPHPIAVQFIKECKKYSNA